MSYKTTPKTILMVACLLLLSFNSLAAQINAENLSDIVKTLAPDEFEGRAPGGAGEEKTVNYLIDQFKAIGLEPGGDDGWTQAVPLLHTQIAEPGVTFSADCHLQAPHYYATCLSRIALK